MPFPHKTVLITGATAGIGRALAERMVENGVFVIAVGRRKDRLDELVAKHGSKKVAAEVFDVSDLEAIPSWAKMITTNYPSLSSIILNAGLQRTIDFTRPDAVSLPTLDTELTVNYLSPLHTLTAFLPHLISLGPSSPASVILVSSGLAFVPIARCANYCATKAAVHSLAWTLRSQLGAPASPGTHHVRVVEIVPPAVQTELHEQQPELVAIGQAHFGMPLDDFLDETWAALDAWQDEEIRVGLFKDRWADMEAERRKGFRQMEARFREQAAEHAKASQTAGTM